VGNLADPVENDQPAQAHHQVRCLDTRPSRASATSVTPATEFSG
jgi:hypothetical protein